MANMTLDKFMKTNGWTDAYMAAQLTAYLKRLKPISNNTIYRYRAGEFIPRPDVMRAMHCITGGLVDANSFYFTITQRSKEEASSYKLQRF